jgi:hypothetical protein
VTVFLAEPVRKGDSFVLWRNGHVVAVDGGVGNQDHSHVEEMTSGHCVDVLICTHADDDHISGAINILCTLGARELWVPADWASLVKTIHAGSVPVVERLRKDLASLLRRHGDQAPLDFLEADDMLAVLEPFFPLDTNGSRGKSEGDDKHESTREPTFAAVAKAQLPRDLRNALEPDTPRAAKDSSALPLELDVLLTRLGYGPTPGAHTFVDVAREDAWLIDGRESAVVKAAVKAIHRIVLILWLARARNARVRMFAYDPMGLARSNTPIRDGLLPINCTETKTIPPRRATLLELTYLNVVNKRSLVFAAPPDDLCPGVLFCGDSDLGFLDSYSKYSPWAGLIITAPHHGSASNGAAYERIERVLVHKPFQWVRSDEAQDKRPCKEFLERPHVCTRCKRNDAELVRFDAGKRACWTQTEGHPCVC